MVLCLATITTLAVSTFVTQTIVTTDVIIASGPKHAILSPWSDVDEKYSESEYSTDSETASRDVTEAYMDEAFLLYFGGITIGFSLQNRAQIELVKWANLGIGKAKI